MARFATGIVVYDNALLSSVRGASLMTMKFILALPILISYAIFESYSTPIVVIPTD